MPTLVQSKALAAGGEGTSGTTTAVTFDNSCAAGNTILTYIASGGDQSYSAAGNGNTYTFLPGTKIYTSVQDQGQQIAVAENINSGSTTVTVTTTNVASRRMMIEEWSGLLTSASNDTDGAGQEEASPGTGVDGANSTAVTTTVNGDLIVGLTQNVDELSPGTGTITNGSGFSTGTAFGTNIFKTENRIQVTAGAVEATFTLATSHRFLTSVAAFKAIPPAVPFVRMSKIRFPRQANRRVFRRPRAIAVSAPSSVDFTFPLDENPFFQDGIIKNGLFDGLDWNDMQAGSADSVRCCFAAVTSAHDSICCLAPGRHAVPLNHEVVVTYRRKSGYTAPDSHESLALLRFNITANNARGYEILIPIDGGGQIVAWHGPVDSFTVLSPTGPGAPAPVEGDKSRNRIVGNVITIFYTPISTGIESQIMTVTDSEWASGNPGFGNFCRAGTTPSSFCPKEVILRAAT